MRAGQPVGDTRKRFTAVALDGEFRVSAVAPLLNKLIKMRNDAGASDLGIGVVSMLGFSSTRKALQVLLAHYIRHLSAQKKEAVSCTEAVKNYASIHDCAYMSWPAAVTVRMSMNTRPF